MRPAALPLRGLSASLAALDYSATRDLFPPNAKPRVLPYDVTLITGDGTGPELAQAARKCVDATGVTINWDVQEAGVDVMERTGTPLPDSVIQSIRRTKCALKAPITTPVGTGFRSINVHLRQELGLYACIRPCKTYQGVRTFTRVPIDLVIVRENNSEQPAPLLRTLRARAAAGSQRITASSARPNTTAVRMRCSSIS